MDIITELKQEGFIGKTNKFIKLNRRWSKKKKEKYLELTSKLKELTSFLPEETDLNTRRWAVVHDLTQGNFKCNLPGCNKPRKFVNAAWGFSEICNTKDKEHIDFKNKLMTQKLENAVEKKYGVKNISQLEEIKRKKEETTRKHYSMKNPFQAKEIKEKIQNTNLEKYGVENPSQSNIIRKKVYETNLQRYGVKNPMQSEKIRQKARETCLQKYGVEYPTQSKIIKQKIRKTNLQKYNVPFYAQSEDFKNRLPEVKQKMLNKRCPNINYERWSSLTKEFIEENFIDSDNHLMVQKLMDYVGWETPTSVYQKCNELGVKWTYDSGGFNSAQPATLYYIYDPQEDMYKIGITNYPSAEERFGKGFCSKRAIAILEQWDYEIGEHAYLAEQEVLKAFKDYRCTNPSWPEELGGKTEFFVFDVLHAATK